VKIRHPEHINWIHIYGWNTSAWCRPCLYHWLNTCGELDSRDYEAEADRSLAHAILTAMEEGEIPVSPLLADFDFVRIADLATPSNN